MAQIEIIEEREDGRGWRFDAQLLDDDGGLRRIAVTLSWADYNLWSPDGTATPAQVAEAVIRFLIDRAAARAPRPEFDASIARRLHADADEVIPRLITP